MTKLIKLLSSRLGNSMPLAIFIALSIVIISCGVFEYMRLMIIASGVRDAVQSSVISVATENYDKLYNGLREGYSGAYELSGSDWQSNVDTGDIYAQLDSKLGLINENGYHIKYADEKVEYKLSGLSVNIINAPFAPQDRNSAGKFLAEATVYLEVPLSFGWEALPPMKINLKLKAGYTPKF